MTVVFPRLQCDMTLVIASIGYEDSCELRRCNRVCLISWICERDSSGPVGNSHCSCISNVRRSEHQRIPRVHWLYHRIVKSWCRFRSGPRRASRIRAGFDNYGKLRCAGQPYTSNWSAEVLLINPFSCLGNVVHVSAVAVALSIRPETTPPGPLPPHLEDIVTGSHPSLGVDGRTALTDLLHVSFRLRSHSGGPSQN